MQTSNIAWTEMVKKEARGLNDFNLGEVQQVGANFIVTEKGTLSRKYYFIPKYLVKGYDGHNLWFNVTEKPSGDRVQERQSSNPRRILQVQDAKHVHRGRELGT